LSGGSEQYVQNHSCRNVIFNGENAVGGMQMKRLFCLAVIGLFLFNANCWAEFTYKELQHIYGTSEKGSIRVVDDYLMGLYEGINAASLATYMQTKRPLFCKPNNFDLNTNDIRSIIKDAHVAHNSKGTIPVSYLLFVGLTKTFPCL
jgi:hypothetical protein